MTCDKEVTPSGTSTARALNLLVKENSSVFKQKGPVVTSNFHPTFIRILMDTNESTAANQCAGEVLAIIANRFSFVFNLKGKLFIFMNHGCVTECSSTRPPSIQYVCRLCCSHIFSARAKLCLRYSMLSLFDFNAGHSVFSKVNSPDGFNLSDRHCARFMISSLGCSLLLRALVAAVAG